jgi:hypothetical protein
MRGINLARFPGIPGSQRFGADAITRHHSPSLIMENATAAPILANAEVAISGPHNSNS